MDQLLPFGWNEAFNQKWLAIAADGLQPARVIADFGTSLKIANPQMYTAELAGKLAHYSNRENVPKVGDWVAVRLSDSGHNVIEAVIPRQSEIARKIAGKRTIKQVIAANVDIAFVLLAMDEDFSVKRLERFLYQLSTDNIAPVIVLNKADKAKDAAFYTDQLQAFDLPIITASALSGDGIDNIMRHILPGKTAILLGSSGVGKSTLTNRLLGRKAQETKAVRESDSTGKHTTVHRELFVLPGGGLLVDTPGIRELQLWGTQEDLDENFEDVALLASQCEYANCRHDGEQQCAIRAALDNGTLSAAHYASYLKFQDELARLQARTTVVAKKKNRKSAKHVRRQQDEERLENLYED